MAGDALLRGALVMLARMAGGARDFAMLVRQREGRLLVVETRLLPHFGVVARSAIGSEAAPVNVVLAVAVDAGRGSLAKVSVISNTAAAAPHHIRVLQRYNIQF